MASIRASIVGPPGRRDQDQSLHRRLPLPGLVLGLRKLRDVFAGILERDEFAAAGQRDRIIERPVPSFVRRQWRQPFLSNAVLKALRHPRCRIIITRAARGQETPGGAAGAGMLAVPWSIQVTKKST
jgi:hypothetical protein